MLSLHHHHKLLGRLRLVLSLLGVPGEVDCDTFSDLDGRIGDVWDPSTDNLNRANCSSNRASLSSLALASHSSLAVSETTLDPSLECEARARLESKARLLEQFALFKLSLEGSHTSPVPSKSLNVSQATSPRTPKRDNTSRKRPKSL